MKDLFLPPELPEALLDWYDRRARSLPWRDDPAPYPVWVSEIMLQQTRVEAVKPYYERFLAALPAIGALADVPEERLLKLWEGLGYYSRARNMQKCAKLLVERYGGELPGTAAELEKLPGIGRYTAGAIASIAFGEAVPAVDGNVLRVVSRLTASREDVGSADVKGRVEKSVSAVLPEDRPGGFNQAMMDLGATVCVPGRAPRCGECPLNSMCAGYRSGAAGELPVKAAKRPRRVESRTVFVLTCRGRLALVKRPEKGLLAGMWELPAASGTLSEAEARRRLAAWGAAPEGLERLPDGKHVFTHVEWRMTAWGAELREEIPAFPWFGPEELESAALPSAFRTWEGEISERIKK